MPLSKNGALSLTEVKGNKLNSPLLHDDCSYPAGLIRAAQREANFAESLCRGQTSAMASDSASHDSSTQRRRAG